MFLERNVTSTEHGPLSVVVGGTVKADLGANVTVHCPVRGECGHFQPESTWPTARKHRDPRVAVLTL